MEEAERLVATSVRMREMMRRPEDAAVGPVSSAALQAADDPG
jgi:hypothetical protein